MPLSATLKKPSSPSSSSSSSSLSSLALPPPHLFANFSYANYIRDYNATSSSATATASPLPLASMSTYYHDSLEYVSSVAPCSTGSGCGSGAVPSTTLTPLSAVLALFGAARAAALKEKLLPRVVTWTPDGRFIMAELDAVFVFGEPQAAPSEQQGGQGGPGEAGGSGDGATRGHAADDVFPTDGGPLHGVELRRGRPMAVRFWGTYEMEGGKIKVLRLARWGTGQACEWPED